jgi:hypothetical protein
MALISRAATPARREFDPISAANDFQNAGWDVGIWRTKAKNIDKSITFGGRVIRAAINASADAE